MVPTCLFLVSTHTGVLYIVSARTCDGGLQRSQLHIGEPPRTLMFLFGSVVCAGRNGLFVTILVTGFFVITFVALSIYVFFGTQCFLMVMT